MTKTKSNNNAAREAGRKNLDALEADVKAFVRERRPDLLVTQGFFMGFGGDGITTSPGHVSVGPLPMVRKSGQSYSEFREAHKQRDAEALKFVPGLHEELKKEFRGRARKIVRDGTTIYLTL